MQVLNGFRCTDEYEWLCEMIHVQNKTCLHKKLKKKKSKHYSACFIDSRVLSYSYVKTPTYYREIQCPCRAASPTKMGSYLRNKQTNVTCVFLYERQMREKQRVPTLVFHLSLLESVLLVLHQRSKLFLHFIFRSLAPFTQLHFARGMP